MASVEELREEVAAYRRFRERGGTRGSTADQARRRRISELMIEIRSVQFREERISLDEETEREVEVFG